MGKMSFTRGRNDITNILHLRLHIDRGGSICLSLALASLGSRSLGHKEKESCLKTLEENLESVVGEGRAEEALTKIVLFISIMMI
jgi:hypothetical protein